MPEMEAQSFDEFAGTVRQSQIYSSQKVCMLTLSFFSRSSICCKLFERERP
jgi:hypothetical protein